MGCILASVIQTKDIFQVIWRWKLLSGNILITKKLRNNESNLTHHKIIFEWSQEKISRQRGRPLHQDSFRQDVSLLFVFISPALAPNWISLCLIAIKFVCLRFLESKTCMFSASVWEGKTHKKQSMVLFVPLFSFCDLHKWKSSNDRFDDGKYFLKCGVNSLAKMSDQCQNLINYTPTPPLAQLIVV